MNKQKKVYLNHLILVLCFTPTADLVKVPHCKLESAESTDTERKLAKPPNNICVSLRT